MGIDGTWAEVNLIAYNDDDQASTLHSLPRPPRECVQDAHSHALNNRGELPPPPDD